MVIEVCRVLFCIALTRAAAYVNIPSVEKPCHVLVKDIYKVQNDVDHVCFSLNESQQANWLECMLNNSGMCRR